MKTRFTLLLTIIAVTLFSSCTRKDDFSSTASASGNYRISLYWDKKDETADFAAYTFQSLNNGELKATSGRNIVTGTWSENSGSRFNINFPSTPLNELNDNSLIEEKPPNSLKLKDDNARQDDKLQFIKL